MVSEKKNNSATFKRGLEIRARTSGASKTIEVEVDKPLGLTLGQKPGGGVVITVSKFLFLGIYDFIFIPFNCMILFLSCENL